MSHMVCTSGCPPSCPDNIANMEALCPWCGSHVQVWRLVFALKSLTDEKIVADSVTWREESDGPMLHTLIHVPESY